MKTTKISDNARKAIYIGTLCSVSYLAVYIARNVLSAVTPAMIEAGYSESYIGSISSLYFAFYAFGQLINGSIGDRIKAKWMIATGLTGAGVTNLLFSIVVANQYAATAAYAMTGFFLSMIYGPMTKVVSENTEPIYATRCSLGYTFASFFGTPSAGLLASFLAWNNVFSVSSAALLAMSVIGFSFFTVFEKKGIVRYGQYKRSNKQRGGIGLLIKHDIVRFAFISIITGVVRTSVVFWLPTYISQYLDYPADVSAMIFTGATLVISLTAFIAVFLYEKLGRDMYKTVTLTLACSAVAFLLTYFVRLPMLNIIFIVLAIMASNGAATMLWSRYCPGLRDTGMVSGATGFLDFLSYMSAAAANLIFANAVTVIGWGNLILVWMGLVIIGTVISIPIGKIIAKSKVKFAKIDKTV